MFKLIVVIFAVIACAAAKPSLIRAPLALALTAPAAVVAAPAPIVTATSSQVIARNHNGIATSPIIAPVAAPLIVNTLAATPWAYSSHLAYSSTITYAAAPAPIVW